VAENAPDGVVPLDLSSSLRRRGPWRQAFGRFRRRPLGVGALAVFVAFVLTGVLANVLAPYAAGQEFLQFIQKPQPPLTAHHLLGTDVLSRDFLTQILFAIHQTTVSALVCAAIATVIGGVVGMLTGYFGGWLDALATWWIGAVVAVPALAVLVIISVSRSNFALAPLDYALWLSAILWTGVARVVHGTVRSLRTREFVEAAHASGGSDLRVLLRHLLPNASGQIIVAATSIVGQSIVIVATIQYLGYAFNQPDQPTLGGLVADGTNATSLLLTQSAGLASVWWLYAFPAALLVLLLLAVTFLGDALDEALNPMTR
jgi:peptide/nickel transport system permease protein